MKHLHSLLLAAVVLLFGSLTTAARADTLMYSLSSFGTTATFTLPSNPTPSLVGSDYFQINGVTLSISGFGNETANIDFFTLASGGGAGSGVNRLDGPQLFSGSLTSPTLLSGSFLLSGTVVPDANGPVSVSGNLVATILGPVPEPSSLLLLLTAAAAFAFMTRRRVAPLT